MQTTKFIFYSSLIIANHIKKITHKYMIYERFFIFYKLYIITQMYRLIPYFYIYISPYYQDIFSDFSISTVSSNDLRYEIKACISC